MTPSHTISDVTLQKFPALLPRAGGVILPNEEVKAVAAPRHYGFIDTLRGFAILGVMCHHLVPHVPGVGRWVSTLAAQGFEGVQLFFVMSAFTLFLSLESRSRAEARPYLDFFIRRFFRIAPLFYAGMAFYVALDLLLGDGKGPSSASLGCFLTTLTFTNGWNGAWINRIVPGGWSIAVEMNFYLLVPLFFRVVRSARDAILGAFLALCGAAFAQVAFTMLLGIGRRDEARALVAYWLPTQLPIFFLGFLLVFILQPGLRGGGKPSRRRLVDANLLLGLSFYLIAAVSFSEPALYLGHMLFGVAFVLLAWSLALYPNPLLVNRLTRYLGKVSFSAYITHFAILRLVNDASRTPSFAVLQSISPNIRFFVLLLMVLTLTLLASTITYHLIEEPGIALGRRLIRKLEISSSGRESTVPAIRKDDLALLVDRQSVPQSG